MKKTITFTDKALDNPHLLPPLALAYVGDAVYELAVRRYLIENGLVRARRLHQQAVKYVRAGAQAKVLRALLEMLTEEEAAIVRRGRNAPVLHVPKGSNATEYSYSTAFECLIGFLYLKGNMARLNQILQRVSAIVNEEKGE